MLPRHPWLGRNVPLLDSLVAASEISPDAPEDSEVWRLPAFTWAPSTPRHGRKGRGRLMPYRVHWDVLVDGPSVRTGQAVGPGTHLEVEAAPERVTVATLRAQGRDARWRLFNEISSWVPRAVAGAHAVRSAEVAQNMRRQERPLLDPVSLETIADGLMLAPRGFFERMLRLVVRPTCFDRADPELWVRTMLRREADQAVGRAVGDVLPGPQIRRLYAMHRDEPLTLEQLIALFNEGVSQSNRIGARRATRALLVNSAGAVETPEAQLGHAFSAPSAEDVYLRAEP